MYLDKKKIKKLMNELDHSHNQLAVFCDVSPSTIWNIITIDRYNVTAETSAKIYKFFKLERKVTSPNELLDLPLIEKIANEGLA